MNLKSVAISVLLVITLAMSVYGADFLKAGQPAPGDGVFFSMEAARGLLDQLDELDRLKADSKLSDQEIIQLKGLVAILERDRDLWKDQAVAMRQAALEALDSLSKKDSKTAGIALLKRILLIIAAVGATAAGQPGIGAGLGIGAFGW